MIASTIRTLGLSKIGIFCAPSQGRQSKVLTQLQWLIQNLFQGQTEKIIERRIRNNLAVLDCMVDANITEGFIVEDFFEDFF